MKNTLLHLLLITSLLLQSCSETANTNSAFKDSLTFYTSFDNGTTADFALGDADMYTAVGSYEDSKRVLSDIQVGFNAEDHAIVEGKGQSGDALEFKKGSSNVIFYKSKDNIAYDPSSWSGTISFWLSVDPATDLKGYTDPIQITDANFNDASIWVDFTDDTPPNFRLGAFGDKSEWTLDTLDSPASLEFERRTINVEAPTFSRASWTHVLITFDSLGTDRSEASLFLNGEKQGTISGIDDPFSWNLDESNIYLGLGFKGLLDELSIFNKPFTDEEAMELYQLEGGLKSIL